MTPKKALVVDDSRSARYSLRKTLERLDISVDCVESGENALDYLGSAQNALPDVIFMDNLMPGMNGFSTSQAIHEQKGWAHIPIIMCTATQGAQNLAAAKSSGAAGILPKPATTGQIQRLLEQLADSTHNRADLLGSSSDLPLLKELAVEQNDHLPTPLLGGEIIGNGQILGQQDKADTSSSATAETHNASLTSNSVKPKTHNLNPAHQVSAVENQNNIATLERLTELEEQVDHLQKQINQNWIDQFQTLIAKPSEQTDPQIYKIHTQLTDLITHSVEEHSANTKLEIEEKIEAQTRGIEHRLMGEALSHEQIVDKAVSAAEVSAQTVLTNTLKEKNTVFAQNIEKLIRKHADKAVSDNIQRIQTQLSENVQAQLTGALKRQTLISFSALSIAALALVLLIVT